MTFLMWQRDGDVRIGSPRRVLRAAELPLLRNANDLCETLQRLGAEREERIATAEREAFDRGHAHGLESGRRVAREDMAAALVALAQSAAAELEGTRNEIGALALQVVRKLLGQFADDEVLVALADTATCDMLPAQPLTLVVHPDLCGAVRERLCTRAAGDAAALRCEVRADPSCARDACRIETGHGSVDAALESQLARLAGAWSATRDAHR